MARLLSSSLVLLAAATGASAFVPPAPGMSRQATMKPSTTQLDVARLDLYPGLKVSPVCQYPVPLVKCTGDILGWGSVWTHESTCRGRVCDD